jgi:plastocyanin
MRIAAVAALSAALVAGGATAANAAVPAQNLSAHRAVAVKQASSINIKASTTRVKAGKTVTFTGRTSGLKQGSKVTLQEKVAGRWVSLAGTTVNHGNDYRITAKLGSKGKQTLRVVDGQTVSSPVTVVVY